MKNSYDVITLQDLVDAIMSDSETFPKGMETVIMTGDFEGNYTHQKHEIMRDETVTYGNICFLGYEMHECFEDDAE